MTIQDVIERSRQPGEFTEAKTFSVDRGRAIEKMREFALVDPHHYILELIQSAVANGAQHIDIECDDSTMGFSYVGGGYEERQLAELFEFLFASKHGLEYADLRQLALGANALMNFEPDEIVIESGSGTLESTTRVAIRQGEDRAEVGTPEEPLDGTFFRAEGLNRRTVRRESPLDPLDYGPPECTAIEERFLAAPIPILVNDEPVFGYSALRSPDLFNYENVVAVDEGDLYGSIGTSPHLETSTFRILTYGCWIESFERRVAGLPVGGIVCYDRLNKTADHAGIVRDDRFEELWARLRPYARQIRSGESAVQETGISRIGGDAISPRKLRSFLRDEDRVVVASSEVVDASEESSLEREDASPKPEVGDGGEASRRTDYAARVGHHLDAPVLAVDPDRFSSLETMAGRRTDLYPLNARDTSDLAFYRQASAEPPDRPWLTGAVEAEPMPTDELADHVVCSSSSFSTDDLEEALAPLVGRGDTIECTVFSPVHAEKNRGLRVRVQTLDRFVGEAKLESSYPGHVLVVDLPDVPPNYLIRAVSEGSPDAFAEVWEDGAAGEEEDTTEEGAAGNSNEAGMATAPVAVEPSVSIAELVARVAARSSKEALRTASERALSNLEPESVEPKSPAARIALAALSRNCRVRLRTRDDREDPSLYFSAPERFARLDLLEAPLFETLAGEPRSMRDLERMTEETSGLVYGVVPDVDADLTGLDERLVLDLDAESERLLVSIVGEAGYVRIDERDILAESEDLVVRDVAVGLRDYPPPDVYPLLVESREESSTPPSSLDAGERRRQTESLLDQLVDLAVGGPGEDEGVWFESEASEGGAQTAESTRYTAENRRQAIRHLQWAAIWNHRYDDFGSLATAMPLFPQTNRMATSRQLASWMENDPPLRMMDGGTGASIRPPDASMRTEADDVSDAPLKFNPWLLHVLAEVGSVVPAFDFDYGDHEAVDMDATPDEAFVAAREIDISAHVGSGEAAIRGRIGIPRERPDHPAVAAYDRSGDATHELRQIAATFEVIGHVEYEAPEPADPEKLESILHREVVELFDRLAAEIGRMEPDSRRYRRALGALLNVAGNYLQLMRRPDGTVSARVQHALAARILDLPLFFDDERTPYAPRRMVAWFCARHSHHDDETEGPPIDEVPDPLAEWAEAFLRPDRIVEPAGSENSGRGRPTGNWDPERPLAKRLTRWLNRLRPDASYQSPDADSPETEVVVVSPDEGVPVGAVGTLAAGDVDTSALRDSLCLHIRPWMGAEEATSSVLVVNEDHWMVENALEHPDDSSAFVWLLLALYGSINDFEKAVTDEHELAFQRRLAEALVDESFAAEP